MLLVKASGMERILLFLVEPQMWVKGHLVVCVCVLTSKNNSV